MTRDRVLALLRAECEKAGSQSAFAKLHGLSHAYVSDTLSGRRDPSKAILDALGLEAVVTYRKAASGLAGTRI